MDNILLSTHITEKTAEREDKGVYTFEVSDAANKYMVAQAVEKMFGVQPVAVRIIKRKGKKKRYGKFYGNRKDRKYAIVSLKKGQTMSLHKGV